MSNSYLTSDGVLIDAGVKAAEVARVAREHGIDIKYLFITHYHVDHTRYAYDIVKAFNCKVIASLPESGIIEGRERPKAAGFLQSVILTFMNVKPVSVDVKVVDDVIEGYKVIYAPSHTLGSTAYFRDGVLFSVDAVVEHGGKPALPPRGGFTLDIGEALRSFNKLLSLKLRIIYPGHGSSIGLGT